MQTFNERSGVKHIYLILFSSNNSESIDLKSKLLALQLIHSILAHSGPVFRSSESFINDIKQILCNSLLQNSLSSIPQIFSLSLSIFKTLILHFRTYLKDEIGVFFSNSYLNILESQSVGYAHKLLVIQALNTLSQDPQTLVEIFVNYDSSMKGDNIFECKYIINFQ